MKKKVILSLSFAALSLVLIVLITYLTRNSTPQTEQPEASGTDSPAQSESDTLPEGLTITYNGRFTGFFIEDGSYDTVIDVYCIRLKNDTGKTIESGALDLVGAEEFYTFKFFAIPSGGEALVLETSRKQYPGSAEGLSVRLDRIEYTDATTAADVFSVNAEAGEVRITNISTQNITGEIFIFYKAKHNGVYFGGRAGYIKLDGLAAGESAADYVPHFQTDESEIIYIVYDG